MLRKLLKAKGLSLFSLMAVEILLFATNAYAQSSSHIAQVNVSQIAVVGVGPGAVSLNITGVGIVAGVNQMTVTDQTTTLSWGANTSTAKISVKTSLGSPKFTLTVQAVSITGVPSSAGISAPTVTLSTTSQDFMTGIGLKRGTCNLLYTGIALASNGTGTDSHTITFTITN
jgi:hypothetical protein